MKGEFVGIFGQHSRWELGNSNTYKMGLPFDGPLIDDDCSTLTDSALVDHKMDSIKELYTNRDAFLPEKESWFRSSIYAKEIIRKPRVKQLDIIPQDSSISGAGMRVYNRLREFDLSENQSFGLSEIKKNKEAFPGLQAKLPSIGNISS
jgi:hypothetical protein